MYLACVRMGGKSQKDWLEHRQEIKRFYRVFEIRSQLLRGVGLGDEREKDSDESCIYTMLVSISCRSNPCVVKLCAKSFWNNSMYLLAIFSAVFFLTYSSAAWIVFINMLPFSMTTIKVPPLLTEDEDDLGV